MLIGVSVNYILWMLVDYNYSGDLNVIYGVIIGINLVGNFMQIFFDVVMVGQIFICLLYIQDLWIVNYVEDGSGNVMVGVKLFFLGIVLKVVNQFLQIGMVIFIDYWVCLV